MNDTIIFIPTLRELKAIFNIDNVEEKDNLAFTKYNNIPIIITGVSKVNATFCATLFFSRYTPKDVILLGIAGAYRNSNLLIGDVVTINNDYFVDDAKLINGELQSLGDMGMPICNGNCGRFAALENLKVVSSNTVSFLSSTDELANIYQRKTGAAIENMEGAAFGLAANRFNINAHQLRAVSNFCGEKQDWNIKNAVKNLKESVDKLIS